MIRKITGMARVLVMLAFVLCFTGAIHADASDWIFRDGAVDWVLGEDGYEDAYLTKWEEYGKPETGMTLVNRGLIDPYGDGAKYGLLDANGNTVLPPIYTGIEYAAGKLIVNRSTGLAANGFYYFEYALMDLKGNILYGFSKNSIQLVDQERGLLAIATGEFYGLEKRLYDSNLNLLPTPVLSTAEPVGEKSPDDYVITSDSGYQGIYRYGIGMIIPCQYSDLRAINNNLYVARKDRNCGVIDKDGRQILPFSYSNIDDYRNGYFIVNTGSTESYGLVDWENNEILPCEFGPMSFLENGNVKIGTVVDYEEVASYMNGIYIGTFSRPVYDYYEYELEQPPFEDVAISSYFCQPVRWAVDENITGGTSATTFSPYDTCTTAQILTFLWRANGSPAPTGSNAAVPAGQYYSDAVNWAYENGLVSGTTFDAAAPCTRSATVTYLWKLAGSPAADSTAFTDVAAEAEYAQAVAWAVAEGITTGSTATMFSPNTTCTRGQIATFLYRAFA